MNKILLLGGTGTLSRAVLDRALEKGYSVTIMNRGSNNGSLPECVKVIVSDFYDTNSLISKFKGQQFDVVVDFLSRTTSDIARIYPLFKNSCQQYIFISSSCVYRRYKDDFPIKEDSPKPNENWKYNIEKFKCEEELRRLSQNASSFYTIIRPYITYNDERIPFGIAPVYRYHKTIIERIKAGKPWFVWDGGNAICTITHTCDFAVGVVGLFLNEKARNEDFHITSDFRYSQREIVEALFLKLNKAINIVDFSTNELCKLLPQYREMLIGDRSLDAIFDNSKIKNAVPELEFSIDINKGLDRIIKYWDNFPSYLYDYEFDSIIDKIMSHKHYKVKYVKYPNAKTHSKIIYYLFKILPYKVAVRLNRIIR